MFEYDEEKDILIKKTSNGWVVSAPHPNIEGVIITCYEIDSESLDASYEVREADALRRLILDHFDEHLQTKWRGGLVVEVEPKGTNISEED